MTWKKFCDRNFSKLLCQKFFVSEKFCDTNFFINFFVKNVSKSRPLEIPVTFFYKIVRGFLRKSTFFYCKKWLFCVFLKMQKTQKLSSMLVVKKCVWKFFDTFFGKILIKVCKFLQIFVKNVKIIFWQFCKSVANFFAQVFCLAVFEKCCFAILSFFQKIEFAQIANLQKNMQKLTQNPKS